MLRPSADYLLVRVDDAQTEHNGLLLVRENHFRRGTVLAVGPGRWREQQRIPVDLQVGERVAFLTWVQDTKPGSKLASTVHEIEGQNVLLLQERDILFAWAAGSEEPEMWQ